MSKALEIFNGMRQHLRGNVADPDGIMALINGVNSLSRYAQELEAEREVLLDEVKTLRRKLNPRDGTFGM